MALKYTTCDEGCKHYDPDFASGWKNKPTEAVATVEYLFRPIASDDWIDREQDLCLSCLRGRLSSHRVTQRCWDEITEKNGPWTEIVEIEVLVDGISDELGEKYSKTIAEFSDG